MAAPTHVIGIDVGTGSARAGIFDLKGRMVGLGVRPIQIWKPETDFVEQSSADIWKAVCSAVRLAMRQGGLTHQDIAGIAFDATASLVAVDANDRPVTVSPTGLDAQNIIVWMDHRAMAQAQKLTEQADEVTRYLGGIVSPEHEIPKLMWLKKNMPESWKRTARFFDLTDWLTYRATGRDVRSLCTTVCKWTYLGHEKEDSRWSRDFFKKNGIQDLVSKRRIGEMIEPMGNCAGGLNYSAANELGLETGTPVAVGIIDAHAGGLAVLGLGSRDAKSNPQSLDSVLCLIGGTSTCHMAVSPEPRFVKGVWGPYYSAMVPGMWLNEGGQSATGVLLDFVISNHSRHADALKEAKAAGQSIYEYLNQRVDTLAREGKVGARCKLTSRTHMLPYFHGNRSPNADPMARGAIHGLTLHSTLDDMALLYYTTIQSIAYGTRDIIDALNSKGYSITKLHACGGGTKNPLWIQEHSDATQCEILLPKEPEAMLLGSAILAAVGSGVYETLPNAMSAMSATGTTVRPDKKTSDYHGAKMRVHREIYSDQIKYDEMCKTS